MAFFPLKVCMFCTEAHDSADCSVYPTIKSRFALLKKLDACRQCFYQGHRTLDCPKTTCCSFCQQNHNVALCCLNNARKTSKPEYKKDDCVFCGLHNGSSRCPTATFYTVRRMTIESTDRCIRCLKQHKSLQCDAMFVECFYCKQTDHHKALCPQNRHLKDRVQNPSELNCIFCGEHKNSALCQKFSDFQQRREIFKKQRCCRKCLGRHRTAGCNYPLKCNFCFSPNHHEAMCPYKPNIESQNVAISSAPPPLHVPEVKNNATTVASQSFFDFIMNAELPGKVTWTI